MPGNALEVREEGMLHLGHDPLTNPEAVRIHHEAKGMTEKRILLEAHPEGCLVRATALNARDNPRRLTANVLVPEREGIRHDAPKSPAHQHGNFIGGGNDHGDHSARVAREAYRGIGEKGLRPEHALGFRAAAFGARLARRKGEKRGHHLCRRGGVVEANRARRRLPLPCRPRKWRRRRLNVDTTHDLA